MSRSAIPSGGALGSLSSARPDRHCADFETPEIQQWSLGVQREIFRNAVLEISYVGTKGDQLIRPLNINQAQPADALRVGLANINTVRPFLGYRTHQLARDEREIALPRHAFVI